MGLIISMKFVKLNSNGYSSFFLLVFLLVTVTATVLVFLLVLLLVAVTATALVFLLVFLLVAVTTAVTALVNILEFLVLLLVVLGHELVKLLEGDVISTVLVHFFDECFTEPFIVTVNAQLLCHYLHDSFDWLLAAVLHVDLPPLLADLELVHVGRGGEA